jgi:hypothetical protein
MNLVEIIQEKLGMHRKYMQLSKDTGVEISKILLKTKHEHPFLTRNKDFELDLLAVLAAMYISMKSEDTNTLVITNVLHFKNKVLETIEHVNESIKREKGKCS